MSEQYAYTILWSHVGEDDEPCNYGIVDTTTNADDAINLFRNSVREYPHLTHKMERQLLNPEPETMMICKGVKR